MRRRPVVIVDMDGAIGGVNTVLHLQTEPDGDRHPRGSDDRQPHLAVVEWTVSALGRLPQGLRNRFNLGRAEVILPVIHV